MNGAGEFDAAEIHFGRAAMIHRLDILHAFGFEPGSDFVGSDNRRAGPRGDVDYIRDVIAVTVRDQNEIRRDLFDVDFFRQRIRRNERVEEKRFAAGGDRETGMAVISKFHDRKRSATERADSRRFFD